MLTRLANGMRAAMLRSSRRTLTATSPTASSSKSVTLEVGDSTMNSSNGTVREFIASGVASGLATYYGFMAVISPETKDKPLHQLSSIGLGYFIGYHVPVIAIPIIAIHIGKSILDVEYKATKEQFEGW